MRLIVKWRGRPGTGKSTLMTFSCRGNPRLKTMKMRRAISMTPLAWRKRGERECCQRAKRTPVADLTVNRGTNCKCKIMAVDRRSRTAKRLGWRCSRSSTNFSKLMRSARPRSRIRWTRRATTRTSLIRSRRRRRRSRASNSGRRWTRWSWSTMTRTRKWIRRPRRTRRFGSIIKWNPMSRQWCWNQRYRTWRKNGSTKPKNWMKSSKRATKRWWTCARTGRSSCRCAKRTTCSGCWTIKKMLGNWNVANQPIRGIWLSGY